LRRSTLPFTFEDIEDAERDITSTETIESYIRSYPEIISFFSNLRTIALREFIIGAHVVYGWMPTILTLNEPPTGFQIIIDMLNNVKQGQYLDKNSLIRLQSVINNSLVGASKLLHFIRPDNYAIWDSRVYRFWSKSTPHHYRLQDPDAYLSYLTNCQQISNTYGFDVLHDRINAKMGYRDYKVTTLRAIEWVAYMTDRHRVFAA
jgi:hypothetical protein